MDATFTTAEVALLAGVPKRTVDKAIEERVLSARVKRAARGRTSLRLPLHAVPYSVIIKKLGISLPLNAKRTILHELGKRSAAKMINGSITIAPALTLDLSSLVAEDLVTKAASYAETRERVIEENPDILGGTPVIRGSRLSVYALEGRVNGGDSVEDILDDYPDLKPEELETALLYASSHRRAGRPAARKGKVAV